MGNHHGRTAIGVVSLALILALAVPALGQRLITVPTGTVIPLRMDTYLSSDSSKMGERFTATVFRAVVVDGRAVVAEGTKVEGHVSGATPAERGSKAGTLAVAFDRIAFPNGNSIPIDGTLTTLSEEGRRKIEEDMSNEDRIEGGSRTRRAVIFIGGGAGAGAVIGAVTGGGKGAAIGAGVGAVLGTIGVFLSKGEKAEVQPGTEFGMMVERSFTLDTSAFYAGGDRVFNDNDPNAGVSSQGILTSVDSIRSAQIVLKERDFYNGPINGEMTNLTRNAIRNFQNDRNIAITGDLDIATARALGIAEDFTTPTAQTAFNSGESVRLAQASLRDRGYYNGPINGTMTTATRNAISQLQRDNNLQSTGDLDLSTAQMLGIASEAGYEARPIEITNPRAERIDRDSIRISLDVGTEGSGWQVFSNRFVTGNTLHVYVRGTAPRYSNGTAMDRHPFSETYDNLPNVTSVIIHGPQRDFTVNMAGGDNPATVGTNTGNARQIASLASRLLLDFQRDLNIRNNRGQVIYDTRRDFRQNEVEVLSQMSSLQATAQFYNQLTASITDPDAVKGAADSLLRQARLLKRMMNRTTQLVFSSTVRSDWDQLQAELARINVTDSNLDDETIR